MKSKSLSLFCPFLPPILLIAGQSAEKERPQRFHAAVSPLMNGRKESEIRSCYRVRMVPEPFSRALSNTSFATVTSNTDIPMLEQTMI